MTIKAKMTIDKTYARQVFRALYPRKVAIPVVIGLLGLAECIWQWRRGGNLSVLLPVCAVLLAVDITAPWWMPIFALKRSVKNRTDGERELYFSEESIYWKNLKYGTETRYSTERFDGAMRRGNTLFLLLERKILMVRPEYFEEGGYDELLDWLRRMNKTADIYDRKSPAGQSYPGEKRATVLGYVEVALYLLALSWLLALLLYGFAEGREYGRLFSVEPVMAAWWMLILMLAVSLYWPLRRSLLRNRPQSLHDLCLTEYSDPLFFGRNGKLLTMALCRLYAGHKQTAAQALNRVRPEKLSRKRRGLYEQARTMPETGEAEALLQESRRLDQRRERLIILSGWTVTLALFVLTYLQA